MTSPPLLELQKVSVFRGGRPALDNLSLQIQEGESVAILGANGSGKSTFVKLLYRELYPSRTQNREAAQIRIRGKERWTVQELRATLGLVTNDLQAAIPPETSVVDAVLGGFSGQLAIYYEQDRPQDHLDAAERGLREADAYHLKDRVFGALSSGEARRVLLARALAHDPSALLLDEPTTSLDLVHAHHLIETVRNLVRGGRSLILVTHHFHEIFPEIQRVILLKQGRVIADGPRTEVMTSENLSEALGAPIQLRGTGPYHAELCP